MKPQPVVVTTICSECGLAWEAHGDKPSTSDCIRLLKAELARRPTVITYPTYPWHMGWQGNTLPYSINCSTTAITGELTETVSYETPIETTCSAVQM